MTQYITLHPLAKDLTNQRYGRLVALGPVARKKRGGLIWLMQCDCGNTITVTSSNLQSGHTKSCGCIVHDMLVQRNSSHGMTHSPTYSTWLGMMSRCHNPAAHGYVYYGERGISVHDEWRQSPEAFHDCVSKLPNYGIKGYTLDRIDNDGNYEPSNVRWATMTQQNRNTRRTPFVTYNGKTQSLRDWSHEFNIHINTLRQRLAYGWSVERALTTPAKKYRSRLKRVQEDR